MARSETYTYMNMARSVRPARSGGRWCASSGCAALPQMPALCAPPLPSLKERNTQAVKFRIVATSDNTTTHTGRAAYLARPLPCGFQAQQPTTQQHTQAVQRTLPGHCHAASRHPGQDGSPPPPPKATRFNKKVL